MTAHAPIQTVLNEDGQPVSVIVPIELWREIASEKETKSSTPNENRLAKLRAARGLWREREDLPDFAALRSEWDRE